MLTVLCPQEPLRIGSAHNRAARPFPGFGGSSSVSTGSSGMGAAPGQGGFQSAPGGGYGGQGQSGGYGQPGPGQQMYGEAATGPGGYGQGVTAGSSK